MSQRREKLRTIVLVLYKIINNLVKVSTDGLLNPLTFNTKGHSQRFKQPHKFLHPVTIKIWNNLPEHLINHADL